jgi:hypothetical protein
MIEEILRADTVKDIAALIDDREFPPRTLVLLERLPQGVVDESARQNLLYFAEFDKSLDLSSYTSGRIFHRDFELRWEINDGQTKAVYFGKRSALDIPELQPINTDNIPLDKCEDRERRYNLFGKRLSKEQLDRIGKPPARDGDFAVLRIPRLLRYPAPPEAEQVQLVVREYVHKETGQLVIYRFERLAPEDEEEKEQP